MVWKRDLESCGFRLRTNSDVGKGPSNNEPVSCGPVLDELVSYEGCERSSRVGVQFEVCCGTPGYSEGGCLADKGAGGGRIVGAVETTLFWGLGLCPAGAVNSANSWAVKPDRCGTLPPVYFRNILTRLPMKKSFSFAVAACQ